MVGNEIKIRDNANITYLSRIYSTWNTESLPVRSDRTFKPNLSPSSAFKGPSRFALFQATKVDHLKLSRYGSSGVNRIRHELTRKIDRSLYPRVLVAKLSLVPSTESAHYKLQQMIVYYHPKESIWIILFVLGLA